MRTLTTPIPTLITNPAVRPIHILRFTTVGSGGTTYYFSESKQTIGGNAYLPYLSVAAITAFSFVP